MLSTWQYEYKSTYLLGIVEARVDFNKGTYYGKKCSFSMHHLLQWKRDVNSRMNIGAPFIVSFVIIFSSMHKRIFCMGNGQVKCSDHTTSILTL